MNFAKLSKNKNLWAPYIAVLFCAIMLFFSLLMPYTSATKEYKDYLKFMENEPVFEEKDGVTGKDMKSISMFNHIKYNSLQYDHFNDDDAMAYMIVEIVVVVFVCLTLLFAIFKKATATILFSLFGYFTYLFLCLAHKEEGRVPSTAYDWGLGYYFFHIFTFLLIGTCIWLFVVKHINKKREKKAMKAAYYAQAPYQAPAAPAEAPKAE